MYPIFQKLAVLKSSYQQTVKLMYSTFQLVTSSQPNVFKESEHVE